MVEAEGRPVVAFTLRIVDGRITYIWGVVNPDKLAYLQLPE